MIIRRFLVFLLWVGLAVGLGALNVFLWQKQQKQSDSNRFLQEQVIGLKEDNQKSRNRNDAKRDEIEALNSINTQEAFSLYEERARREYGMVASRETFFPLKPIEYKYLPDVVGLSEIEESLALVNSGEALPSYEEHELLLQEELGNEAIAPLVLIELESLSQE